MKLKGIINLGTKLPKQYIDILHKPRMGHGINYRLYSKIFVAG